MTTFQVNDNYDTNYPYLGNVTHKLAMEFVRCRSKDTPQYMYDIHALDCSCTGQPLKIAAAFLRVRKIPLTHVGRLAERRG